MSEKKMYAQPELTVYGNVESLTQQNGVDQVDVPQGTPASAPGGVTGPFS